MDLLIWIGAALSAVGLAILVWCIIRAIGLKRAGLDDAATRQRLQGLVAWNLGAVMLSVTGLGLVVVGILLA